MCRLLTWKFLGAILGGSIAGLAICCLFGRNSSFFAHGALGVLFVDVLAAAWSVALVVLLPLKIFRDRRSRKEAVRPVSAVDAEPSQMNILAEAIFYANYGSLPRSLFLPFVVVLSLLVLLAVFCVTVGVVWSILHGPTA